LFGWTLDQKDPAFLPFLVVLHLGTAAALLIYFWRDWYGFALAVLGRGANVASERRLLGLVFAATLPAVIIGFALEHVLRGFFGAPSIAAFFLIVNGVILFWGERIRKESVTLTAKPLDRMGWGAALAIGACQALALIPGISRSGATMVGGLLAGLSHKDAARFSFLLATPVIAGAGVLEVPKLMHLHDSISWDKGTVVIAGIVAGVTAYISVVVLMRYFKKHEIEALNPFAYYCWAVGALALVVLAL
jgi:undecaprenyl-diphosphatase